MGKRYLRVTPQAKTFNSNVSKNETRILNLALLSNVQMPVFEI